MGTVACVGLLATWLSGFGAPAQYSQWSAKPVVVVPTAAHARLVEPVAGPHVAVKCLAEPAANSGYAMRNTYMRGLMAADLLLVDRGEQGLESRLWTERLENCGGPMIVDFPVAESLPGRAIGPRFVAWHSIAEALSKGLPRFRDQFQINAHVGASAPQIVLDVPAGNRDD
ncbi:MAG: hypothetical protein DWQ37_06345 [Planctomycetota bacterium]|nr:MAG: hypothetical protein DWQ37_06345 [Planctomycetota bacterium]